jgi:hypothetical protein
MFGSRGIIGRSLAVAAAVMMAGAGSLASAPGAAAASRSVDCSTNPGNETVTLAPGEGFNVTASNCRGFKVNSTQSGNVYTNATNMVYPANVDTGASFDSVFVTSVAVTPDAAIPASATLILTPNFPWAGPAYVFTLIYAFAPATVRDQTPQPWHQSYARVTADEKCLDGWNPSYAMWPNDGKGGWVCVRTLHYNNSTKTWDVN